jgi:MarR family transcriptional regulator, organic hydroperoxide resistance regulator
MRGLPLIAEWQRVTHRLLAALDDELSDLGLSAAETNLLACFAGEPGRAVRELVAATGQRPSTLTGVLDRLERRGLVARTTHPDDRRSVLVRLTSDGERAAERVATAFAEVEASLPADEIRRVLAAVAAAPH